MSEKFELRADDVVSSSDLTVLVGKNTFKYSELQHYFGNWVSSKGLGSSICQGIKCEFLRTSGGGWKKGKFFIRVEFIPDPEPEVKKPESPLDEFRQQV